MKSKTFAERMAERLFKAGEKLAQKAAEAQLEQRKKARANLFLGSQEGQDLMAKFEAAELAKMTAEMRTLLEKKES